MTREEILKELYDTQFVPNYIRKLALPSDQPYLDDLEGDVWVILCEIPEQRLIDIYNQGGRPSINNIRKLASGIIYRQEHSETSTYYKRYKRPHLNDDTTPGVSLEWREACGMLDERWERDAHEGENDFAENINL